MCVVTGLAIAQVAVSAINSYQQANALKYQSEIEAKSLIEKGKIAERNAAIERQEGIEEARNQKLSSILNMQKEKTLFASNNILTSSQTSINVFDSEKIGGELNALNTIKKADGRSDKYLQTANDYYQKASLTLFKGKQEYKNALSKNIGGTVISLASKLGG